MKDPRHGPLPWLLIVLTVVTGLVDAVSYLRLGHVFVSNMTGNIVFLGFAVAGAGEIAPQRSLVASVTFAAGSAIGGRLSLAFGAHRGRFLSVAIAMEVALIAATLACALGSPAGSEESGISPQIVLLALAMGIQNATARTLAVPDLTTTVITLTLTAFASESYFGTGTNRNATRRLGAMAAMFVGALAGGALVLHRGTVQALLAVLVMLLATCIAAHRVSAGSPAWAKPS